MTKKNKLLTAILKLVKPCSTSDEVDQYFRYCKEEIQEKQLETVDFETFLKVFLPVIEDKLSVQFLLYNFPLTPMGVLAPRSAHARPSAQPPIDMSGNFPAHVSAESPSKFSKKT